MSTALVAEIPLPALVESRESLVVAVDAARPEERVNWMRGLGPRQLSALWELAADGPGFTIDDLVPDQSVTIGEGKNGLPVFSWFQKRFARIGDEIGGYNHNSAFVTWWVGPGHFTAYDAPDDKKGLEVWIDYTKIPKVRHPDFPELAINEKGILPRLVYGGMIDKVRRVSKHLLIGDSYNAKGMTSKGVKFALTLPDRG